MFEIEIRNNNVLLVNKTNNSYESIINFDGQQHNNLSNVSSDVLLANYIEIINSYQTIQKYTYGETTSMDILAMTSLVFKKLMAGKNTRVRALEIGSWFGCSSFFFASSIKVFSKNNYLFCMDTWEGSPDTPAHHIANYENVFDHFRSVMKYGGVYENIKPLVCDSTIGLETLQDNFFDIIFIDANHTYDYVYQDIIDSIKKIKVGGLLMGHDCECFEDELPNHIRYGDNKHLDIIEGYHTGVIKALNDIFGRSYSRFNNSLVWYKIITEEDKQKLNEIEVSNSSNNGVKIAEIVETVGEAIEYLYSKLYDEDSEIYSSLLNDTIRAVDAIENQLYENSSGTNMKITTNMLKSTLLDFKISYDENEKDQSYFILENNVLKTYKEWINEIDLSM